MGLTPGDPGHVHRVPASLPFRDRRHAGAALAGVLGPRLAGRVLALGEVVVLGLARGGVPVAAAVATQLGATLDVLVVRKLGVPGHRELALGAVASGDVVVRNEDVLSRLVDPERVLAGVLAAERAVLHERERTYRAGRPPVSLEGRSVVVVDDGLATGATMRAGVLAVRRQGAGAVVAAAPVGSDSAVDLVALEADDVVCAAVPERFGAVSTFYRDFDQTSDDEVIDALGRPG